MKQYKFYCLTRTKDLQFFMLQHQQVCKVLKLGKFSCLRDFEWKDMLTFMLAGEETTEVFDGFDNTEIFCLAKEFS